MESALNKGNGKQREPIPVDMRSLERRVDEFLASSAEAHPPTPAEAPAPKPKTSGELAAAAVEDYANRAADGFRATKDQILGLATSLGAELDALADDVSRRGSTCARLLSEFTQLTQESGKTVSAERERFANFPHKPSED